MGLRLKVTITFTDEEERAFSEYMDSIKRSAHGVPQKTAAVIRNLILRGLATVQIVGKE